MNTAITGLATLGVAALLLVVLAAVDRVRERRRRRDIEEFERLQMVADYLEQRVADEYERRAFLEWERGLMKK